MRKKSAEKGTVKKTDTGLFAGSESETLFDQLENLGPNPIPPEAASGFLRSGNRYKKKHLGKHLDFLFLNNIFMLVEIFHDNNVFR